MAAMEKIDRDLIAVMGVGDVAETLSQCMMLFRIAVRD